MKFKLENKVLEKALKRFTQGKGYIVPPVRLMTTSMGLLLTNAIWSEHCLNMSKILISDVQCDGCGEVACADLGDLLRLAKLGGYAEYEADYGSGDSAGKLHVSVNVGGKNKTASVVLAHTDFDYTRKKDSDIDEKNPGVSTCDIDSDGFVNSDPSVAFTVPAAEFGKFFSFISNGLNLASDAALYAKTGIQLINKNGFLRICAYRNALLSVWDTQFPNAVYCPIPVAMFLNDVAELLKLAGNAPEDFRCRIGKSRIVFESSTWCYDCGINTKDAIDFDKILSDGKFDAWDSFGVSAADVLSSTKELDAALKADKSNRPIFLSGGTDVLRMSIQTPRYEQEDTVTARGESSIQTYMNPKVLLAGFKMFDCDDVTVRYRSAVDGIHAQANDITVFMLPVHPSSVCD